MFAFSSLRRRLRRPWPKIKPTQEQARLLVAYDRQRSLHYSSPPDICPVCDESACYPYREAYYYTTVLRVYRHPPGVNKFAVDSFYPPRLHIRGQ